MEKVSDHAKEKLNGLGIEYLIFFIVMFGFSILLAWAPKEITLGVVLGLLAMIFFISIVWLDRRKKITKENKEDARTKQLIESSYMYTSGISVKTNENYLDKKLKSVRFTKTEEISEIRKYCFWYKILLDKTDKRIKYVHEETILSVCFEAILGNIIKINEIDYPALLPYPDETNFLLERVFNFISKKYCQQKKLFGGPNHTSKIIRNARKCTIESIASILLKNYQIALKIFLSEEEFEIAGTIIEGRDNKKLFLITAIKTENQEIVLFPEKTITDIFEKLNNTLF